MNFRTKMFLLCGFLIVSFLGITKEIVVSSSLLKIDTAISLFFFEHRTPFLTTFFLWVTTLGNLSVILSFSFLVSAYLALTKKFKYFLPFVTTLAGSGLTVYLLKIVIGRDRPGMGIAYYAELSLSFPSGHAALSVALYGYVAYLFVQFFDIKKHQHILWALYFIASFVVLLIGLSRIYLGVHFLTDILGGYVIGLLWLGIGISLTETVWKK